MNSKPDEQLLALWLEDELDPADHKAVEAWVAGRDEWLEWRRETREWKVLMQSTIPAEQTPPADEFFSARIQRLIRERPHGEDNKAAAAPPVRRITWWLPFAAAAGMTLCFWAGTHFAKPTTTTADAAPTTPEIYTPEQGVEARVFESASAEAMVIVLDGVAAIPDSFEIPDRAERSVEPASWMASSTPLRPHPAR